MRRAVKVTMSFATGAKRRAIRNLLEAYRGAVNFYIRSLWQNPGRLDAATLARLTNTRLSARFKSQALKQALEVVVGTRKAAAATKKYASLPVFRGSAVLDAKFVSVEEGRGAFDLIVKLSTLNRGRRIVIPTRKTAVSNKWLVVPLAKWVQGCALSEDKIVLWVDLPDLPMKTTGTDVGVDLGVNKLVTISDGETPAYFGRDFRAVRDKVKNRKPGSRNRQRAIRERDNFVNRVLNQIPWGSLRRVAVEDLRGIKHGKKKGRGKAFRRAMAPWVARRVLSRIGQKADEHRVLVVAVPPANTSRCCPRCNTVSKKSRVGESFCCVSCGYAADADFVGATNILSLMIRLPTSVESVGLPRAVR